MTEEFSPTPEAPVLVIGAASVDIVGVLKGELQTGTSNPAKIRTSYGGVARNVAENLARLGQAVNLLTVVGEDQNGEQLIQNIKEAGVIVDAVKRTPQYATGTYLGVVNAQGEMQLALDDMRPMTLLSPDFLKEHEALFREASLLFVDSNLPKDTLRTAMSLAKSARLPVCADPTSTGLAVKLKPYLSRLHMVTPSSAEAAILTDRVFNTSRRREALQAAKHLVSQGVDIVVIAMAAFGVCYATSETSGYIPAIRTEIIDPTGAGDAMTATILFALLNDIEIDDAVRLGVSAASLTLRHRGSVVPNLSLEELYNELVI